MYLNEKEMEEICKRYGIEIIDKNDSDYYKDDDLSMVDIMNEPYVYTITEENIFSESMEISIIFEDCSEFHSIDADVKHCTCEVSKDASYNNLTSVIDNDSKINKAA